MNTPRCSPGTDWPRDSGQARGGAATGQGQWEVTATSPACRGRSDTPPVLPWSTVLCPDPDDLTRRHSVLRTGPCTWPLSAASRHGDRPAVGPPGNSGGCLSRPECGSDRLAGSGRFVSLRGMKHSRSPRSQTGKLRLAESQESSEAGARPSTRAHPQCTDGSGEAEEAENLKTGRPRHQHPRRQLLLLPSARRRARCSARTDALGPHDRPVTAVVGSSDSPVWTWERGGCSALPGGAGRQGWT